MMNLESLLHVLKDKGVIFEKGLNEKEITDAEDMFGFRFPPDLKDFLQTALPKGFKDKVDSRRPAFPNWRDLNSESLHSTMSFVLEGILFDVENNNFWLDELGSRPDNMEDAKIIMTEAVNKAPKLIPVYSHRFIPADPPEEGNPIFSVYQTDIIYYGLNLSDYFMTEFGGRKHISQRDDLKTNAHVKRINFWTNLVEK